MPGLEQDRRKDGATVVVRGLVRQHVGRVVVDNLDVRIDAGEFVALLGESGCGKTTLLRALAGLVQIDAGHVDGPAQPAVVFQEHRLMPWMFLWRNVALGIPDAIGRPLARAALGEVGLAGREEDLPRASPVGRPRAWRWRGR